MLSHGKESIKSNKSGFLTITIFLFYLPNLHGEFYRISADARFVFDDFQAGKAYECYFDAYGDIAYIVPDSGTMSYLVNVSTMIVYRR